MTEKDLNIAFKEAFNKACAEEQSLVPPDLQLHLYAYYKRAIDEPYNNSRSFESNDLRSAFKMNALIQVQSLTKTEAKKKYIEIIEKLYPKPW
ncbi:acyl-CoA-binding protein [uncultured Nonlabens sp.]|uniref:acyl-CoA-binding protein n=1 Tax=uncultured Nonlabens sp. TaxID=859306 RepID=UPI002613D401|nr:acyl-CoA-binding protein [uncultured Nonlabens sp.]